MRHLIIHERVERLECQGAALLIRREHLPLLTVPLRRIETLVFLHSVSLPSQLISTAGELGIALVYINPHRLHRSFTLVPPGSTLATLRMKQLWLHGDKRQQLEWVRAGLQLKLKHLQKQVWYCRRRRQDCLRELTRTQATITRCQQHLLQARTIDQCRGLEGKAQQAWFSTLQSLLPASLGFTGRKRQPPSDPVNALLSLTYTQLYLTAWGALLAEGLDAALGLLHKPATNRQSLACDLMEPLRPAAEYWVMRLFNSQQFRRRDFVVGAKEQGCRLTPTALQRYQQMFEQQRIAWKKLLARYSHRLRQEITYWEPQCPVSNSG